MAVYEGEKRVKLWFFVGDTIEWLCRRSTLSGVPRVTLELFLASLDSKVDARLKLIPCTLTSRGLTALSPEKVSGFFAAKSGRSPQGARSPMWNSSIMFMPPGTWAAALRPTEVVGYPSPGDHVLFTGVVWTPVYTRLFRELHQAGIKFSVFVHDIIPAERPEFVSESYREIFIEWLRAVTTRARFIFVSSDIIRDQIVHWARQTGHVIEAKVVAVKFGSTSLQMSQPATLMERIYWAFRLGSGPFVLSVGTVDRRKNQALLSRVWKRLEADLGATKVPRLVLAGRIDLKFDQEDGPTVQAFRSRKIVTLRGVSDRTLAYLYDACLFTVFPSLCEGYGLPVDESLGLGKLCLSADLPVIKERAGRLAWYFDPTNETAAYDCIRGAIDKPELREQAERQIAESFHPVTWNETLKSIVGTIAGGSLTSQ